MIETPAKPWYKSKSIWLAVLVAVISLIPEFSGLLVTLGLEAKTVTAVSGFILSVVMITRRVLADTEIPPAAIR